MEYVMCSQKPSRPLSAYKNTPAPWKGSKPERARADSTHVLGAIQGLYRLETVGETMRATLHVLATVAGDWLRTHVERGVGESF
jgi:hypothetical protein